MNGLDNRAFPGIVCAGVNVEFVKIKGVLPFEGFKIFKNQAVELVIFHNSRCCFG